MRDVIRFSFLASALVLLSGGAEAQTRLGQIGFSLMGRNGVAGSPCWGADCIPRSASVVRGETIRLRVQAPFGAPFAIGFAPSTSRCLQIPGVSNWLVLGDPISTLTVGRVVSPDFGCYFAMGMHVVTIPNGIPPGMQIAMQSWAYVPTQAGLMPTWSIGILATVQ